MSRIDAIVECVRLAIIWGLQLGFILGGVYFLVSSESSAYTLYCMVVGAGIGAMMGAVNGLIIGSLTIVLNQSPFPEREYRIAIFLIASGITLIGVFEIDYSISSSWAVTDTHDDARVRLALFAAALAAAGAGLASQIVARRYLELREQTQAFPQNGEGRSASRMVKLPGLLQQFHSLAWRWGAGLGGVFGGGFVVLLMEAPIIIRVLNGLYGMIPGVIIGVGLGEINGLSCWFVTTRVLRTDISERRYRAVIVFTALIATSASLLLVPVVVSVALLGTVPTVDGFSVIFTALATIGAGIAGHRVAPQYLVLWRKAEESLKDNEYFFPD